MRRPGTRTVMNSLLSGSAGLRPVEPKFVSLTIARRSPPSGSTASIVWNGIANGGQLGAALEPAPFPLADGTTGTDLYIAPDRFREVFAADVEPEVAALMAATQRPIAASALEDAATKAAWQTIPSWALIARQDLAIPLESTRFMATRAGSTTVEIDASHAVAVSQPASSQTPSTAPPVPPPDSRRGGRSRRLRTRGTTEPSVKGP